jgi:hypothetical protein
LRQRGCGSNRVAVQFLSRLLLLIAVLLMPLGMAPAPASAPDHSMIAGMPMGHCPDQGSRNDAKQGVHECTMACAAALPATEARDDAPLLIVCEPILPDAAERLHGLHPETATPPPKRS